MRYLLTFSFLLANNALFADTINHFMEISNNIPKMEMKADPQSQAWARSARNVLAVTNETVAETLLQANEQAKAQGHPLFCLPPDVSLNSVTLNGIIVNTYNSISSQQSDKDKMTVSQVAWLGVSKKYPCTDNGQQAMPIQNGQISTMQHVAEALHQKNIHKRNLLLGR